MNREIQNRKKRFWAFCLALVLAVMQLAPVVVYATEYTVSGTYCDTITPDLPDSNCFFAGDIISYSHNPSERPTSEIVYYDKDGSTEITTLSEKNTDTVSGTAQFVVKEYPETGMQIDAEAFKGWEKKECYGSGGALEKISLKAVAYAQSNIHYVLDGGENAATNPNTYYEGKKTITLEDATKTGYTFIGWYTDETFAEEKKVTSIPTTQTGNVTLYANFTANAYNITYHLDEGTNGAGNPEKYFYGTGVTSLADATKAGYTFEGWYSDAKYTTKVTGISATELGPVDLYAKFKGDTYTITYVLGEGESNDGSNPENYVCGVGVGDFADATKTGYTFDYWYEEGGDGIVIVDSVPASRSGNITLYAKFTANDYTITYVLNGGANGAGNPTNYTYGTGVTSFADASKTGYTFVGWYSDSSLAESSRVTTIPATQTGDVTLYAKFTANGSVVELQEGVGAIKVADSYYGEVVKPVLVSITNGTDHVVITYKKKGAADTTYSTEAPVKPGTYTARAVFAKTDAFMEVTATTDFSIVYLEAPASPYSINGTKGKNDYYTSNVTITPSSGYLIADSLDGVYQDTLELAKSSETFSVYLKKTDTGAKTAGIKVPAIKIDKTSPVISGAKDGETIYGEKAKLVVKDENLRRVSINGKSVEVAHGKATLLLYSNRGEEKYEIIGTDLAGNKKKINITVAAEWTKKKTIPSGEKVRLYKNRSYKSGSSSFQVNEDNTTYAGNVTFYVGSDGDYVFSDVN